MSKHVQIENLINGQTASEFAVRNAIPAPESPPCLRAGSETIVKPTSGDEPL
jgi:hypothetical protein